MIDQILRIALLLAGQLLVEIIANTFVEYVHWCLLIVGLVALIFLIHPSTFPSVKPARRSRHQRTRACIRPYRKRFRGGRLY
jgi:hypothetical protein